MKNYGKLVTGLIAVWFVAVLSASALHLFKNDANRVGIAVGIAAVTPITAFAVWFAVSEGFRKFTRSLDPVILTSLQAWRIVGFIFVLLEAHSVLPAIFAWPAGYGDMAIGATAAFAAWKLGNPAHRNAFLLWQALGIADLVLAVSLGTTAGLLRPNEPPMVPLTVLPLSLIPTFLVPLFVILHVICITQARSWKASSNLAQSVASSAQPAAV
jgi:hypothetical protein